MIIGTQTLTAAGDLIDSLFRMYGRDIDKAYMKAEGTLTISLNVKLKPSDDGGVDVDAGISFVTDRVKDSIMRNVQEGQEDLFKNVEVKVYTVPNTAADTLKEALNGKSE